MSNPLPRGWSRRQFLVASAGASIIGPAIHVSANSVSRVVTGDGEYRYEVHHHWPQLPKPFSWQITHGVAIDPDGLLYVIHEGRADLKDHPSIFVFDQHGRYVRSFGQQFQGGGHGIEIHVEDGEPFLYVCAYQQLKTFAKMTLRGETVWQRYAPMKSGIYAEGEAERPEKVWGRDRFMPTNFAFLENGDFYLADGYGSYCIHRYDRDGNWKGHFGGPGKGEGTFNLPHGIVLDNRPGRDAELVVCDRAHHTLQRLSPSGAYHATLTGFGLPANADLHQNLMVVPELLGRVSLLDRDDRVIAQLGDDSERIGRDKGHAIRRDPSQWRAGKFVHPHDACFDHDGNLFVAEWVATGRVTKLTRLS